MFELVVTAADIDDIPPIILESSHYLFTVHARSIHIVCINVNDYRGVEIMYVKWVCQGYLSVSLFFEISCRPGTEGVR